MRKTKQFIALAVAAICLLPLHVQAASPQKPPSAGIGISPFLQTITFQPSDTQRTYNLTLINHSNDVQELTLQTKDFGSLNDTGGIILEGNNVYSQKYGLSSWITLEKNSVVLNPQQSGSLTVTIDNRLDLQPGGHYGAIIATVAAQPAGSRKIQLQQQLVSLLLVTKTGGEHYNLAIRSIEQNGNWIHLPTSVRLHFQNPGNVHVIPRGLVRLLAPNGNILAQGAINTDSAYILPESFRDINVPLSAVHKGLYYPGIYHIEVDYRYEGIYNHATTFAAVRFISLPLYLFGAVLVVGLFIGSKVYRTKRQK